MPKTKDPEYTSAQVAKIAARLTKITDTRIRDAANFIWTTREHPLTTLAREIRAVAASALTQTRDKPKPKKITTRKR